VLGFSSRRAWSSLLAKEPETNSVYKHRHRRFNVIAGTCSVVLLFAAVGFGVIAGKRIEKNKRLDAILSQITQLAPKNAELRGQIKAIRLQETPTFQDFYFRSLKLESVLDEYDLQRQRLSPLMRSLLPEVADQPKLAETVRTIQRINDKDAEIVEIFRLEIARTKDLIKLPASEQANFYRQEIVPLEQKATSAADEEIGMMQDAEKAGIKLPTDLQELFKPSL